MDDLTHQPFREIYAESPLRSGKIWDNSALMNLWIVCHDGYRHASMQENMPRSGRPRATTAVDDRYLQISARRNPDSNDTMLNNAFCAATGRRITTQTVRNRLHNAQLHSRRPWRGPSLQPRGHAARYGWAYQHAKWTPRNWHHVLITDECRICLQPDNRRLRVWR